MSIHLEKISPKFREQADLLLFSNRLDLDLSKFKELLKENYNYHYEYLWDRFQRSLEISWEDNISFWSSRLQFLFKLNDKALAKRIETLLEKRMFDIIRTTYDIDIKYNIEYLQFIELCKIKHERKEPYFSVKKYLTEMPSHLRADKLISIVNSFIPIVFSTIDEYVDIMSKKIVTSTRNYDLLLNFQEQGIIFNKKPIIGLAKKIVLGSERKLKTNRAFFTLLNDIEVRQGLKNDYGPHYRPKLLSLLKSSEFSLIEEFHLRNLKNLIDLDASLADELTIIYADKLYARGSKHKHANADRLIRLLKLIPQISQKKVLVYLSSNNKMTDIKYFLNVFPDLKKLAAFV